MTKRTVVVALGAPLGVLLLALGQSWVTGTSSDPLLGRTALAASGTQLVPAAVAVVVVLGAALVALLSGGPRIRTTAGLVLVLGAATVVALVARALTDPAAALGRRAAELAGRTGSAVPVTASVTSWAWVGLAASVALVVAAGVALVAARGWAGLSTRFDRAEAPDPSIEGRTRSAWDELTEGHDPTRSHRDETT